MAFKFIAANINRHLFKCFEFFLIFWICVWRQVREEVNRVIMRLWGLSHKNIVQLSAMVSTFLDHISAAICFKMIKTKVNIQIQKYLFKWPIRIQNIARLWFWKVVIFLNPKNIAELLFNDYISEQTYLWYMALHINM